MAFDLTSFLVGGVAGVIVGALIFTQTGKTASSRLVSASASRAERYIRPK